MLEVKFELNINVVRKKKIDSEDVDPATIWETIDIQLEELNEGEFINVSKESDWDEKDIDAPRESDVCKNATLNDLIEIFHEIENAKDKIWKLTQT